MPDASVVSAVRISSYDPSAVREALDKLLEPIGGPDAFVDKNAPALLKPNFLRPAGIESALTTHPAVIRAVAKICFEAGARPVQISDSPGVGTAIRCAERLGIECTVSEFEVLDADDPVICESVAKDFAQIRLSKRMLKSPALINLAKLKTHAQMGMTLSVKNLFGAVVGMDKIQWHYRAGRDPLKFAELVVRIYELVSPRLNLVDGIIGMEGNGPGSGTARPAGFLMASTNGHALDTVVCRALGIDPMSVYTLRAAEQLGLFAQDNPITVVGDPIARFRPHPPWKSARPFHTRTMGPKWLTPVLSHLLTVLPTINRHKCTVCRRCIRHCAAEAMRFVDTPPLGAIRIDKKKCISCFCCQEICPEGAISVKSSKLAEMLGIGIR